MKKTYKTVSIKGNDFVHIMETVRYPSEGHKANSILCNNYSGDISEVNKFPTCPECAQTCLERLNRLQTNIQPGRVLSDAYGNVFDIAASRKGKCDKLHKSIYKLSRNYPYVPNNHRDIAGSLNSAFRFITTERNMSEEPTSRRQLKFLDAGCGIGNIVTLAHAVGFKAHGIELNNAYLQIARRLTTNLKPRPYFECADIITFDRYHKYDLIYYYVPIADFNLQTAFEIHLTRGMKVGAYMLPTGSAGVASAATKEGYFEEQKRGEFNRPIFEKVKEVPKNWIPNSSCLRKEYKRYVGSLQSKNPYK